MKNIYFNLWKVGQGIIFGLMEFTLESTYFTVKSAALLELVYNVSLQNILRIKKFQRSKHHINSIYLHGVVQNSLMTLNVFLRLSIFSVHFCF